MNSSSIAAKRASIGVLSLVCLGTAVGAWLTGHGAASGGWQAVLGRVGIVLGALWLALPARGESVAWGKATPILVVAVLLVAVTRRAFPYVLPIAVLLGLAALFLRPRSKRARDK